MKLNVSESLDIDAQQVVTGRGCVIGQSGSGKSYLVGVIVEELARARLPFVIIDTEGEYKSLKSLFNILHVGREKDSDIPIDVDFFRLFEESIEGNVPVILDVSEEINAPAIVYGALESLYKVEEEKRKPYLVIIEEADKFAPQIVRPRANPVEEISVRGRKRGIGLLVATQRPANISKNVLAQCSYGFIGRLGIENDLKAVEPFFETRKALKEITELKNGQFLPFGLGDRGAFRAKVRSVKHVGSTPLVSEGVTATSVEKIVDELSGKARTPRAQRPEPGMQTIIAMKPNISQENADEYARRLVKKQFGLFGKNVENIEAVRPKYIRLFLCILRVPKRKKGEYDEGWVLINSRGCIIDTKRWLRIVKTHVQEPARLAENEQRLLAEISIDGASDPASLQRATGFDRATLEQALDKLERKKLVTYDKGKVSAPDYRRMLGKGSPTTEEMNVEGTDVIGRPLPKSKGRLEAYAGEMAKTLFPGSIVMGVQSVSLPIYEITLRNRNGVRIFELEGLYGRQVASASIV